MDEKMNPFYKNIALWLVITLMMILLYQLFSKPQTLYEKVIFSDFLAALEMGNVLEVNIQGS
jgi:cell division protease FtsH